MQLHTLKRKNKLKTTQQVGRGGTRGKTSGKGTKGQNARSGRKKRPEIRDTIKRFPKLRGRGVSSFKSLQTNAVAVNLKALSIFEKGDIITPANLIERGLVNKKSGKHPRVKILGVGEVTTSLVISGCEISKSARAAIEKAGGRIQ